MNKLEAFARFHEALDYLQDKKIITRFDEVAENLGIKSSALSNAMQNKDRRFTEGFLKRFASAYSAYINENWLLSGEGNMEVPDSDLRPHIQAKVSAGFMDGISEGEYANDLRPSIPFFNDYDFTIEVQGQSMLPEYKEGDILACRIINDRLNPPIGKVCVIDSSDGAVVKEIKDAGEESILLHSFNSDYPDYEIYPDVNTRFAVVVGSLRPL